MNVNLKRDNKGWIFRTLQKELWPDSVTDMLVCGAYGLIALAIAIPTMLLGGIVWLGAIAALIGVSFIVAAIGLRRERPWAAMLATALTGITGSWLLSLGFAARTKELWEKQGSPASQSQSEG